MDFGKIISLFLFIPVMSSCEQRPDQTVSKPSGDQLVRVPYVSTVDHSDKEFFLYLPEGYQDQPNKKWPVILFLHGDGERGNGRDELKYVLKHGPIYEAWVQKTPMPFIMISPQLPVFGRDTLGVSYLANRNPDDFPDRLEQGTPEREPEAVMDFPMAGFDDPAVDELEIPSRGWELVEQDLLGIIDKVLRDHQADPGRLYITGLSYGGFGTWYMASRHPELFAAASPVVGWGHPDLMEPIAQRNLPLWIFSGGRDTVVPKKYFIPGVNKLEELGHTNLRYTIHDDMAHDAWKRVYGGKDLYDWFLEQTSGQ